MHPGLEVPPDTPELDERCRSIERGAKLITAMPSISALVLQMPRGNLETIYPRALVLAAIRLNINDKEYKKAFLSCRSQRVDMNILHDHDSSGFLANVETFIDQVKKVEYIDLFLSQLREEDVSRVMYKETVRPTQSHEIIVGTDPNAAMASKVNTICDAFLAVLQHRASTNLQNIITAHVCKIPPDLSAGLLHVAKLQSTWKICRLALNCADMDRGGT
jgi:elongator complex protein 1